MTIRENIEIEESFLQQEIMLGVALAVGIIIMGVDEVAGRLVVGGAMVLEAGLYMMRINRAIKDRREKLFCYFTGMNSVAMILSVAGMLMLMLQQMDAFHRPVFFIVVAILCLAMVTNAIMLKYNMRGMMHITAQIRLMIALVVIVVFFLL